MAVWLSAQLFVLRMSPLLHRQINSQRHLWHKDTNYVKGLGSRPAFAVFSADERAETSSAPC